MPNLNLKNNSIIDDFKLEIEKQFLFYKASGQLY
jgi:hypothetical protein